MPRSQAEQAADRVRSAILDGEMPPGSHLDEGGLVGELGVSRNTLREAFRVLAHEGVVEHLPHRGVFVRRIERAEGHHIYAARRHLECGALHDLAVQAEPVDPALIDLVDAAVSRAEEARERSDWRAVGNANAEFHLRLAGLGQNPIVERMMRTLTVEVRLLFLGTGDPLEVHSRYVDENRRILELVRAGHFVRAAAAMELYLLRAEEHIVTSGVTPDTVVTEL